mgnify:CR=1 FL=1
MSYLTPTELAAFERDGYVIKPGYFTQSEIQKLQAKAFNDPALHKRAWQRNDSSGTVSKVCIWQELGDDLYSMFSRSKRLSQACEQILGEEVYHTSTKIMMKEPHVGGAWEWHQDFGYWHGDNLYLYPKQISCMTAINQMTQENGCLQVLKASHHIGRLNHHKVGDQKGAEKRFLDRALEQLETVYVELSPGDTLIFHCNLLHKSNQNTSAHPRWSIISAYNALSNQSIAPNEAVYYPFSPVSDEAIERFVEVK